MHKFNILTLTLISFSFSAYSQLLSVSKNNIIYNDNLNLYSDVNKFSFGQPSDIFNFSPDKKYVLIQRIENYTLYDSNNKKINGSKNYCDVIRLSDGCPISYFSGAICGAYWNNSNELVWYDGTVSINDRDVKLLNPHKLSKFIEQQGLVYNISAYSRCYPVNVNNKDSYEKIEFYLNKTNRLKEAKELNNKLKNIDN
ncbi:hypothetical protein [Vibrio nitrifigilis]|uniref:Uncharacterized protein n=1 Tax=Vibrio nitrifigilis TaxID=2789781 RepID=A0ABS0GDF7_9VIBR|nr:hypothetical protein [Vibrio nitrifigilis]MBF9000439.1 hypothetical protein [Vibrio nitrifigilis]